MARIHGRVVQKGLNDLDGHNGVVTHLEPDILQCEVKWSLWSITTNKASRGGGIPAEKFQILKDDAVKVPHPIRQQISKNQHWPKDQKRAIFIPMPKKGNCKECSNYHTSVFISQASKVMLNIFQARLQQYLNWEISDVEARLTKDRRTRDQFTNIHLITEKAREF